MCLVSLYSGVLLSSVFCYGLHGGHIVSGLVCLWKKLVTRGYYCILCANRSEDPLCFWSSSKSWPKFCTQEFCVYSGVSYHRHFAMHSMVAPSHIVSGRVGLWKKLVTCVYYCILCPNRIDDYLWYWSSSKIWPKFSIICQIVTGGGILL